MGELRRWEPADAVMLADEACLDRVAEGFARVVDAKSPWTYQHSTGVAEIAVGVARQFGCSPSSATFAGRPCCTTSANWACRT